MNVAIWMLCIESVTKTIQAEPMTTNEKKYAVELQAGPLGAGVGLGLAEGPRDLVLFKARFDTYIQGTTASAGLHYRLAFGGSSYYEAGVGVFKSGTDEALSDDKGPYASMAFGTIFSGEDRRLQFGVEWTTISILFAASDSTFFNATLPKLTMNTRV
jgi:hypothetical protein